MNSLTSLQLSIKKRIFLAAALSYASVAMADEALPVVQRGVSAIRAVFSYEVMAMILAIAAIICILGWAFDKISVGRIVKIAVAGIAIGAVDGIVAWAIRTGQG